MSKIFSDVTANIDNGLKEKFPADFDYISMIKKVSEDAGVDVQTNVVLGEDKHIALHGVWVGIERVHSLLATALAVYGARVTDRDTPTSHQTTPTSKDTSISSNITNSKQINSIGNYVSESLQRPETSSHDNELGDQTENSDQGNGNDTSLLCDEEKPIPFIDSTNNDSVTRSIQDDNTSTCSINESEGEESSSLEKPKLTKKTIKRHGSTTKLPSQQIFTKFRSKFRHGKKYNRLCEDRVKLNKGRGRPKKLSDGDQEIFQCPDCDFVAKTRNNLSDHKHRIHQANPSMCDVCQKVFPNRRYMKRHRTSHIEPQHGCDVCGKMYKIHKAMLEHKKTHEKGYAKPLFPCQICSKTFCSNYILSCHVKSEHLGQKKTFLCSVCGKSFTTKHSLQEHSNAHNGAKPHICEVCGKGFSYESALRDHKFVHVGSKQFICEICSKAFTQRSGLKMHMRIHQESKQFTCNDCGREFTQKQALQRHERVHKGDKPFICKLCSRTFSDASIIRRHMILVHKIHKDARTWREDIICKVKGAVNYHVERVSEADDNSNQSSDNTTSTSDKSIKLSTILEANAKHVGCDMRCSNGTTDLNKAHHQSDMPEQTQNEDLNNSSLSWISSVKTKPGGDIKDQYDYHSKSQILASTSSINDTHAIDQRPLSYGDTQSKVPVQEILKGKIFHEDNLGSKQISSKYPQYSEREIAYLQSLTANRLPQLSADLDSPKPNTYYESNQNSTKHYQNITDRTSFPQAQIIEGESYSPEKQSPDRPTHIPVAYPSTLDGQALYSQVGCTSGEQTLQYPSASATTLPGETTTTTNTSNFSTTAPQPWSMYAYYSHLASQFGMTLSDYPYMSNQSNS